MAHYLAIWPIADRARTTADLIDEAWPYLVDMLEDANLSFDGNPEWDRGLDRLTATVPVVNDEASAGDMRPWMSREARVAA